MPLPDVPIDEGVFAHPLIVFDGTCVLCSAFYRFVLRTDRNHKFRFATAQSEVGQALYTALNLSRTDFETNLVVMQGAVFTHLDSFAAVMGQLHWPWRALRVLRWLPEWLKTPAYRLVARNRYRLLGRHDTCVLPDAQTQPRFVQGGW